MSVHVWSVMSKGMIIYSKHGCNWAHFFAGGLTDVDRQWKCMHMHELYVHYYGHKKNVCVCPSYTYTHTFLILFLDFISSLDQLSFPLLGICIAHFSVITLDLLNHCFLAFIL